MFANVDVDSSKVSLLNPLSGASEPECNVPTLSHSVKVMTSPDQTQVEFHIFAFVISVANCFTRFSLNVSKCIVLPAAVADGTSHSQVFTTCSST